MVKEEKGEHAGGAINPAVNSQPNASSSQGEIRDVLAEDLAAVMDGPADDLPMDFNIAIRELTGDGDENVLVCRKCKERRIVPRGTFLTFQEGDLNKFYCRYVGAECSLIKHRRAQI